jgi:protein-tyrosine phosphatase
MNQIIPYLLRVGHNGDGLDFKALFDQGVQAVVQVAAEEPPLMLPRDLIFCRIPLADGPGNRPDSLRLAIETMAHLLRERVSTLVCCGSGVSRAPVLAAAGLSRFTLKPLSECLQLVTSHRHADVHPALYEQIAGILASMAPPGS